MTDKNWLAVYERVLSGLRDGQVLEAPPVTERDLMFLAETISDHVASGFEMSKNAKRYAKSRKDLDPA